MKKLLISTFAAAVICCSVFGQELNPGDVIWEFETESSVYASPVIGPDNEVFIGTNDHIYALNGLNGEMIWKYNSVSPVSGITLNIEDETIYASIRGTWEVKVIAINSNTGEKRWAFNISRQGISAPSYNDNGIIYVGTGIRDHAGLLIAINDSGKHLWEFKTKESIAGKVSIGKHGKLYFGSHDKKVHCLDGKTGEIIWEFETSGRIYSSPAIGSDGTIYAGSYAEAQRGGKLYALDGNSGKKIWEFTADGNLHSSPSIGVDGTIYIGSDKGIFYGIRSNNGQRSWAFTILDGFNRAFQSGASVSQDGVIYVGSLNGKLYALNNSSKLWEFDTGDLIGSVAAISSNGIVYIGSKNGKVYALKGTKGLAESAWPTLGYNNYRTGSKFYIPPVPPDIVTQPISQTLTSGSTVTLSIIANSLKPLSYQWYKNGKAIEGATTSSLQLDNVTKEDETTYYVRVKNEFGVTESDPFQLIVKPRATSFIIDDVEVNETEIVATGTAKITIFSDIQSGEIFYTLDGTAPTFTSNAYLNSFELKESATIRAIAYSADFTKSIEAEPVTVTILSVFALTVDNAGGGTVKLDPPNGPYVEGAEVTFTAIPEGEWDFIGWAGDSTSSESTITIAMDGPKTLKAIFGTSVTVNEIGAGKVIQMPPNPVPYGSTVGFQAVPDDGNYFFRWSGEVGKQIVNRTYLNIVKPKPSVIALFDDRVNLKSGDRIWFSSGSNQAAPALSHKGLIVYSKGHSLVGVDALNGILKWELHGPFATYSRAIVINEDNLAFLTTANGVFYAINCDDGGLVWKREFESTATTPAIPNNDVIYATIGGTIYALSAKTGDTVWKYSNGAKSHLQPAIDKEGNVYVTADSIKTYNSKGIRQWSKNFYKIKTGPILHEDSALIFCADDKLLSYSHQNGELNWEIDFPPDGSHHSPVLTESGDVIFAVRSKLYSCNPLTGEINWQTSTDSIQQSLSIPPAIDNKGVIYIGAYKTFYAFSSLDGSEMWRIQTNHPIRNAAMIGDDGTVYFGTAAGVYALKTSSTGPADSPWPMFGRNAQRTGRAPSPVADKIKIYTFSKSTTPFSLTFESKSDSTYKIEASHDLKQWGEIGEVQGTGSSVEFTDWREALFQKQYYRLRLVE